MKKIYSIADSIFLGKPKKKYSLKQMLQYCQTNVKFYKNIKSLKLDDFPILTKTLLKENYTALISQEIDKKKWWVNTSGGSTGEPAKFIQDKEYLRANRYVTFMQKNRLGYNLGDNLIKLWGDENEILKYNLSIKSKILNKIKNTTILNSFNMSQENMMHYFQLINSRRPKIIVAYAQAIYELSLFLYKKNLKVNHIGSIISSAGTLYPYMREIIEDRFNTNVYNRYGSREVGNIACEAPGVNGLVVSPYTHIEVLNQCGEHCKDGEEGDIVVTSLINYSMPIIRYKIGDRGVLNRTIYNTPVFEKISGRVVNMFKKKDGTLIDGEYFTHLLYNKFWIDKFQVIQDDYNSVNFYLQINRVANPDDLASIEVGSKAILGKDSNVNFIFVDKIKPTQSGKYLYTICKV